MLLLSACGCRAAEKMHFPAVTPLVKMRLKRPAGRDKRENKNNISVEYAQSETAGISNRHNLPET